MACRHVLRSLSGKDLDPSPLVCHVPIVTLPFGLGSSGCLNQAKDKLAYAEGLWDPGSWCGPWVLCTCSGLWVRARDGRGRINKPCDPWAVALVALGELCERLVLRKGHAG